ncbi:MAG: protein-L-isoaspartate(D-aspartate) O-methyltransferase [Candidatus Omnitrophica bacterium]|nr:protein-L-isoaspartate(D-aspartate) O-methyltransferase [Candidatus Omnitrophota bacterium]
MQKSGKRNLRLRALLPVEQIKRDKRLREARNEMVEWQLRSRGITNERVLAVFQGVPREAFVPKALEEKAYEDHPLPIGFDQTISQPYIVALMSQCLELTKSDRVLEIGTGSGYQTAILAELVQEVYSLEILEALYQVAKSRLESLGYSNIYLRNDNGSRGWPEGGFFDKIIVTAAAPQIPPALVEQLKEGGKIVIPIGTQDNQNLVLGQMEKGKLRLKQLAAVRFVPLQT